MIQHELLMLAAAPLLVLGSPLAAWSWALPERVRKSLPSLLARYSMQASSPPRCSSGG
jgi:cytochrome c oxidase assembly factor CtaG